MRAGGAAGACAAGGVQACAAGCMCGMQGAAPNADGCHAPLVICAHKKQIRYDPQTRLYSGLLVPTWEAASTDSSSSSSSLAVSNRNSYDGSSSVGGKEIEAEDDELAAEPSHLPSPNAASAAAFRVSKQLDSAAAAVQYVLTVIRVKLHFGARVRASKGLFLLTI